MTKNVKNEISASDKWAMRQAYANIRLEGLTVSEETQKLVEDSLRDGTFDPETLIKQILDKD